MHRGGGGGGSTGSERPRQDGPEGRGFRDGGVDAIRAAAAAPAESGAAALRGQG